LEPQVPTHNGTSTALPEESAEDLYENAPCGYISTLPNGTIVRVNRTFLTWTGYTREELLGGKRFQDLLSVGGRIFHETHYAPLLRMQGAVNEINFEVLCKDGRALPALINSVQKRDEAGKPVLNRTTLFNITDRKNYERELLLARKKAEEAARAKADFLSMISHEIRTPMNAIIGLSGLLLQTELSSEQQKYITLLQSSSENLLGLLNNILDFSKIEAGKVTLEERRFDIRQLIYGIFYSLNLKAEEKRLATQVEVDERLPTWLIGDPIKIGQVLANLLSNAIKFTETGLVKLSLRVREQLSGTVCVDFKVADTGIGIPEDRQAQVFEEFTQASYDISLKYGGTGLGLAICQKLLELYGGKLGLESAPGRGSTFSFSLRLKVSQEAEAAACPVTESSPKAQSLSGLKVLVAEDNSVNVFVLSQYLRKWGVDFDVVGNGKLAVQKVQETPYHLVLMDLQMPEMDGYEATRTIRHLPDERLQRLPIIALTASNRIGLEDRVESAGFTDFAGKPFKPEDLFAKLALLGSRVRGEPAMETAAQERKEPESGKSPPRFTLEHFRRLAEGDQEALIEFSAIAVNNCEQHKQDLEKALTGGNLEEFDFHVHKMKMTVELMQATTLQAALRRGRELLLESQREPSQLQAAIQAIHAELDTIIEALKTEMRTVVASFPAEDERPGEGWA
jgi:PAS domain S-box-containing protein